jgi:MFS family permease
VSAGVTTRTEVSDDARTSELVGIHIAGGAAVVVTASLVAALLPSADSAWRIGAVAFGIGLFAARTRDLLACAAVVALAWLVVNGFLVDRLGQLFWHGPADLARLALLAGAAAVGLVTGSRIVPRRRARRTNRSS